MKAEAQYSILQNKFRVWFEDPVPSDISLPEEADRSIEDLIPADPKLTGETKHLNHRTRRRNHRAQNIHAVDPTKLLELLFFGFIGAASFGMGVGISFHIMNLNTEGWYNYHWPSQSAIILIATVVGFNFGLFIEYVFLQRERYK